MAKSKDEMARRQTNALTGDEAEKLFETVDETGHSNEEVARRERSRRKEKGTGVDVDPLSSEDPSGSNVGKVIAKTAVGFVLVFLVIVVVAQVLFGVVRRSNTADLAHDVTVATVASALRGGVSWGNGFTQFPEDFSVQEADENTGTVEVTVIDTTSKDALECFSGSQVQASAFSVNCLLNPNINTVIYHVNVHMDENGKFKTAQLFGFLKPTGDVTSFITFVWSKTQSSAGVNFNCNITGVDSTLQEELRDQVTTSFTPVAILNDITGSTTESGSSTSDDATSGSGSGSGSGTGSK
ncbi:MAG: hypothetical protein LKI67_06600 [Olsenella sp.]|jgi:hypothetical protein|nr:hypothetical protein [Olsenella sp.]MCH3955801.1 hypothetical protein [Olsenella sp.]MCI1645820.1 hypothetical protein [Olsenella sp.]MCI1667287.1 hypothetical protein [Olsenella sp.]MCI1794427.1 hypothetical protein [Olsenella sp.]